MDGKKIGIIIGVVVLVITIAVGAFFLFNNKEPKEVDNNEYLNEIVLDDTTKEILENELKVDPRGYMYFDIPKTGRAIVRITNNTEEAKSYNIEIVALRKEENRVLHREALDFNDLKPGEAESVYFFEDLEVKDNKEFKDELLAASYYVTKIERK